MHRFRSWTLDPPEWRTQRNRLLPIEGGDGSTLSLDFTSGVLDPRLTFSRTTNATFINSQGLVEWADANMIPYSEILSGTPWAANGLTNTDATITNPIGGTNARLLSVTASGGSKSLAAQMTVAVGFNYTMRVWVRAGVSSSMSVGYYLSTFHQCTLTKVSGPGTISGSGSGTLYQTITGLSTTEWTQIQLVVTPSTAGSGQWYIYPNTPTNAIGDTIYVWGFQVNIGSIADPYYKTDADAYYAPRFDYDPATLQPRGLLIEGSATNLVPYSNIQAAWAGGTNTTVTPNTTEVLSPDGTNNAAKIALTNAGYCSRFEAISNLAASTTYTFSYWIRGTAGNQQRVYSVSAVQDLVTQTTLSYSTTGWTRVQITFTTTAVVTTAYIYVASRPTGTASDVIYIWGAQLEVGSGASSLIPTGASTANRTFDSCVMTGTNFSSWFAGATEGVLYTQFEKPRSQSGTIGHDHSSVGMQYASGSGFSVYAGYNNYYPTTLLWPTGGAIFPGGIASAVPAVTKQAGKWFGGNDATNYANGVQGTTSAGTGTLTPTMLSIGANSASGTAATRDWLNACVHSIKFWPVALSDAQIIAITT